MYDLALNLLNEINDLGFESFMIGGYPRDKYLNIYNEDIDICTSATYDDLKDYFEIIKCNFGSMVLKYNGFEFEITTYRKESDYDKNRFPKKIEFVDSLEEDLKRRDFVINTLCINKNGEYVDLLNAKEDLNNKIIRCVGDSDYKISQDILRSLRAIRFAVYLNFDIDINLKKSIKKYGYLLDNLSIKRKEEEINKILSYDKEYGISLLKELEIFEYLEDLCLI